MKLLCWNVNGIRSIEKKGFITWLLKESPDILCVQETKCNTLQLGENLLYPDGYESYWSCAQKKGYSGVGVYTKIKPISVKTGFGIKKFDNEGRILIIEFDKFTLLNIYFPNGGSGNKRVPYKMEFYDAFLKEADKLNKKGKNLVICGDVNTAHTELDLARPKENSKRTGFLPEEREWVSKFLSHGYIDTFRHFIKDGGHYTWWDYKTRARQRNIGWRIDYFIINEKILLNVKNSFIMSDVLGSDHCPIGLEIKL